MTENLSAGAEASTRNLSQPVVALGTPDEITREHRDESFYRAYLYWTPHREWAVSGQVQFDNYSSDTGPSTRDGLPTQVETWSTQLSVEYFDPLGFFCGLTGTFLYQDVSREVGPEGNDSSFVVDTTIGYRFPQGLGLASVEVRDNSFREFQQDPPFSRFIPERTILGRLTLNF